MTANLGFVTAAAQLGLTSLIIKPARSIGLFIPAAVFEENHVDQLEITEHPVEYGSKISDHAYRMPSEVTIHFAWSNSPNEASLLSQGLGIASTLSPAIGAAVAVIGAVESLAGSDKLRGIYKSLLKMQATRELFSIETGKRSYANMLLQTLSVVTDQRSENSLMCTAVCREVLLAYTTTVTLGTVASDPTNHADPKKTAAPTDAGTKSLAPATNYNPKKP